MCHYYVLTSVATDVKATENVFQSTPVFDIFHILSYIDKLTLNYLKII